MRATLPSTHKPVNQVTAGVGASILDALQVGAEQKPMLTLAVLAAATTVIAAVVAVIAAGVVLGQHLSALAMSAARIARMVPVRAIWQNLGTVGAAVLLWAMTHKRQIATAVLVLNAPGIILELIKLIK